jgi:serine/threonine-protein kinase
MTPETWPRVKALFAAAREQPPSERARFLDEACGRDTELRREVESLLSAETSRFLDTGTQDIDAELRDALAERYRLEREVGRGGMATVFLAHDLKHDRSVALKLLHPDLATALGPARFHREIMLAARLQHPHILTVLDSGESAGQLWFTMPFVEGESLRDRLNREMQLPVEDALRIAREAAEALDYAHRHGVIHRDVKPDNIMLTESHALVTDFGIARALGGPDQPLTQSGVVIGTPAYMSPEQASGIRDVDARTDVYALGCVLFEMLAGEPPYTGPTPQAIMARALTETPRPIHPMRLAVPEALDAVIAKATATTPSDRYGSAAEFARALEPQPTALAAKRWRHRGRRIGLWAGALLVVLGAGTWIGSHIRAPQASVDPPIDPRHIVAVLPFRNLSADTSQDYFAEGITEEINGQVSRISALRVLGRGATAPYEHTPDRLHRLNTDLGVGTVVEGTTRLEGQRARIGVSLTDTHTGQTLWSDQYDRDLRDVLLVEGDVAKQIAAALAAALTPSEARSIGRKVTQNAEAYDLYLRSTSLSVVSAAQNQAGIELLQQAIRKDSTFAPAWAGLGSRYGFAAEYSTATYYDSGLAAASRAVALDSDLPFGHFVRGDMLSAVGRIEPARLEYLKALELDPNEAPSMADLSVLEAILGRYDESLNWALRSVPLLPNRPAAYFHVSLSLILLGDQVASERWLTAAAHRFPDTPRLEMTVAWLDCIRGRGEDALDRARRVVAAHPDDNEARNMLANLAVATGAPEAKTVIEPLYRGAPEGQGWIMWESYRSLYALLLSNLGERESAQALWTQALASAEHSLENGNESFIPRFEIAAIHAARGDTTEALEWLDRAYQAGWRGGGIINRDRFFDGLHGHPRFREIVRRAESDVAAMRRRAEEAHPALFRHPS